MQQKNETSALILSLLITLGILGVGSWWLIGRVNWQHAFNSTGNSAQTGQPTAGAPQAVASRLSTGERLLFPTGASPQKQAAIQAIAQGNYETAISNLEASLEANRNDPEALVYLNNARIGNNPAYAIAISLPIGTDVNAALEMLRGVAQAQNDINQAGGINGLPLRVVIANDDNDPAIAQQVAQALVDNPTVLGVVGHYSSDVTLAAAQVYQSKGLVSISPVSTSVKLSGFGDYIFRTVPSDFIAARALAEYALRNQQTQAAVFFNSQSGYSQSIKSEFVTALSLGGGQTVSEFDLSAPDFSPSESVAQARQQGATVLVLLPNSGQLDRALQVVQINQRQLALLGGDSVYAPKTLEIGGEAVVGMVVAVAWDILSNSRSPFVVNSRRLWGGDVNWRTAMAYDGSQALITAIQQDPTRKGVMQTLRSGKFAAPGASGPVRFLPSGDRNAPVQLVKVAPGTRSRYGFDFVPVRPGT